MIFDPENLFNSILENALEKEYIFHQFKKELSTSFEIKKIDKETSQMLENLYLTHLFIIYSKRRYFSMLENVDNRPYWQYVSINDLRTCQECRSLANKVFRFDDVFWKNNFPPNHIGCRCRVRALSPKDIERNGIQVESDNQFISPNKKSLNSDLERLKRDLIERLKILREKGLNP